MVEYESGRTNQKALIKHVLCECRCKVDGKKCKSKQKWNNNKYQCESKNSNISTYAWKSSMCACEWDENCEISKYLKDYTCTKRDIVAACDEKGEKPYRSIQLIKQIIDYFLLFC